MTDTVLGRMLGRERGRRQAEAAGRAAGDWTADALQIVRDLAAEGRMFTTDDVWARVDGRPDEPRAMGAVMIRAKSEGVAVPTSSHVESARPDCNGRPVRVWRPGPNAASAHNGNGPGGD